MIKRIINFYYEGFSNMRLGKTLWLVVIVKLIVIFVILKLFFMPDILSQRAGNGGEADYVSTQIVKRANLSEEPTPTLPKGGNLKCKKEPVGGIICFSLQQTLTICCITEVFAYGFHLHPTSLQKMPFHIMKGYLLEYKRPCFAH